MMLRMTAVLIRLPFEKFSSGYDSDFLYKYIIKFQHNLLFISTCNYNFRLMNIRTNMHKDPRTPELRDISPR
jgi:hypothetical protein